MQKNRILALAFAVLTLALSCLSASARSQLDEWSMGVPTDTQGNIEANASIYERYNKMACYVAPSYDYNDATPIDPTEAILSYMPVYIPEYIIKRSETNSTTYIDDVDLSFNYSGDNSMATSTTTLDPLSFQWIDGGDYRLMYSTGGSVANSTELLHGVTYSEIIVSDNSTQAVRGLAIQPNNVNVNVTAYVTGRLTIVCEEQRDGSVYRYMHTKEISTRAFLQGDAPYYIDYALDTSFDPSRYSYIISRFEGDVIVKYGAHETNKVIYTEDVSGSRKALISFDSDTQTGFDNAYSVSIEESYFQAVTDYYVYGGEPDVPSGTLYIDENGVYNVRNYANVNVRVPVSLSWSGMFDWLFDSVGAFMSFEIAPDWSIGTVLTILVGLAIAIWALKVFLGG